ncbi:ArsR/SmtB family transcription factor [Qipengyuania marisflavi]|uniref:Metalloregulator ArsR/SmtB family transcription factor n=1 Tax=Qipengyuania marisflavi TaxID=2486356 RepID=A0A5S3PUN4_9SPHN|nr:metalloregulator ArsR/SmtB family transcription factor [Qipengyuania marisflavi]TMM47287.1 metalloregulator ArsR/SmtB family transcription factor [Qipengyuania marisflavi]
MQIVSLFSALSDPTRLRILRLIASMELAVGEVALVLGQSQPRVSRQVGILCDVGLAERRREGSWTFLRACQPAGDNSPFSAILMKLLAEAEEHDAELAALCAQDRRRLAEIRAARDADAQAYFAQHSQDWDELRRMHSSDERIEAELTRALDGLALGELLDIGTGTGRMAEIFSAGAERIVALDKSPAMLRVARAKLQHLPTQCVDLVQGDFTSLPFPDASFDTVLFHQVLHFAQSPAAVLAEAARVTRAAGRIAIVDFAAHHREELRERHAHARLGFEDDQMASLLADAGFKPAVPKALEDGELTVKIWLAERYKETTGTPS